MPAPAFIVEGQTEQRFLQYACPKAKVVLLGSNGRTVSSAAIADRIALYYKILNNRYYPIIVLFDRESRAETCSTMLASIRAELEGRGLDPDQFRIGIVDRKIETWMLYSVDEDGGSDPLCQSCGEDEFEGATGEGELARRLRKVGVEYHKTTVGVGLLRDLNAKALANKSMSFRTFTEAIGISCHWLDRPMQA